MSGNPGTSTEQSTYDVAAALEAILANQGVILNRIDVLAAIVERLSTKPSQQIIPSVPKGLLTNVPTTSKALPSTIFKSTPTLIIEEVDKLETYLLKHFAASIIKHCRDSPNVQEKIATFHAMTKSELPKTTVSDMSVILDSSTEDEDEEELERLKQEVIRKKKVKAQKKLKQRIESKEVEAELLLEESERVESSTPPHVSFNHPPTTSTPNDSFTVDSDIKKKKKKKKYKIY